MGITQFERAQTEYLLTKRADHLAVKEPTYEEEKQDSYTVMREIRGRNLFDILDDDNEFRVVLTTQQRIDITRALLKALKEQVIDKRIVHRDIKPENVLVEMDPTVSAAIIDFGFSIELGQSASRHSGSPGYVPPELFETMLATEKYDVYSMARIVSVVWRIDLRSYTSENIRYYANNATKELESLFYGITDLSEQEKSLIKSTLKDMLNPDPSKRKSIEETIQCFDRLVDAKAKSKCDEVSSVGSSSSEHAITSEITLTI